MKKKNIYKWKWKWRWRWQRERKAEEIHTFIHYIRKNEVFKGCKAENDKNEN